MNRWVAAVLASSFAWAGCARPVSPVSAAPDAMQGSPVEHELARLDAYELPRLDASAAYETVCRSSRKHRDQAPPYGFGLQFEPVPLFPWPYGPRIREMPRAGPKRTLADLYEAVRRQTAHMNGCYRWARYSSAVSLTSIDASVTVDSFGLVTEASVTGTDRALEACVKDGLLAMRVSDRTPRVTKARFRLDFGPSGLGTPRAAPPRPRAQPSLPLSLCIQVPTPMPVDELIAPEDDALARFDDWSREQEEVEFRRAHPGQPRLPRVGQMCTSSEYGSPSQEIERTIQSNMGAYRQCYIDALRTNQALTGELVVRSDIGDTGSFEHVQVHGPGGEKTADPGAVALAQCMRAAFEELQLQPMPSTPVRVLYTFELTPREPPSIPTNEPLQRGRAQLERLDADGALASFAQAIRGSGGGADECWGRLGVVQAVLVKAPWVFDTRVWTATEAFIRYASHKADSEALAPCLRAAGPLIARVGTWPYQLLDTGGIHSGSVGRWKSGAASDGAKGEALERAAALLGMTPKLPGRMLLLEFLASGIAPRGDVDETISALVPHFAEQPDPKWIRPLRERLLRRAAFDDDRRPAPLLRPSECPYEAPR